MQKIDIKKIMIAACFIMTFFSTVSIWWMDYPIQNGETVLIPTNEGHSLIGTYYSGENLIGILFLEGFGSDQTMLKPLVSEFADWGAYMMTFDFSGHGRSPSTITFDNAASDRLALEILAAKSKFKELSGLNDDQIFMVGHSMGARMALWAATLDPTPVKGLILLGCQVNLVVNTQASFFTGVDDRNLTWISNLNQNSPETDILLFTGEWDDILTPTSGQALLDQLSQSATGVTYSRDLIIFPHLVHNYEIYSPRVVEHAKDWMKNRLSGDLILSIQSTNLKLRISAWVISLISFTLGISFLYSYLPLLDSTYQNNSFQILDMKKFLRKKLLLWGAALPLSIVVMGIFMVIPLGLPIFNLIYVGFISAYGFVIFVKYRKGKMDGTSGILLNLNKILDNNIKKEQMLSSRQLISACILVISVIVYFWGFANTGWFYVFPLNDRIIWLILFIPFSTLGFFISQYEFFAISTYKDLQMKHSIALNIIGLFPFIIFSLLFWILGSLSGMIGGLQGLLILFIVVQIGNVLNKLINRPLVVAIFQAVCLQLLVLPITALFRF